MNTESMVALAATLGQIGSSVKEVTEAINKLSNTFKVSRYSSTDMFNLDNLQEGEITYNPELKTYCIYNGEKLIPIQEETILKANYEDKIEETKTVNGNLNMNLYDLNKAAVIQLSNYSEADKQAAKDLINSYDDFAVTTRYYMLLCRELNYYTVFQRMFNASSHENFGDVVIECLENLGNIKSIDLTESKDAIEAWVVDPNENEAYVAYLFNYDQGVIICE